MSALDVLSPREGEAVSHLGFTITGTATGGQIPVETSELEPKFPQRGEIQQEVPVKKLVPAPPVITITVGDEPPQQAAFTKTTGPRQPVNEISGDFSLKEPQAV
jgi:hypothetical protein